MAATSERGEAMDTLGAGHEPRDVHVPAIVGFGVGLIVLLAISYVLLWWLLEYFAGREATREQPPSVGLEDTARQPLPPEPRLQIAPSEDLRALRDSEAALLHSYGWGDRAAGIVRIPIERAIQLLVERGLPAAPDEPAPPAESK